jgi:hypothetical protein
MSWCASSQRMKLSRKRALSARPDWYTSDRERTGAGADVCLRGASASRGITVTSIHSGEVSAPVEPGSGRTPAITPGSERTVEDIRDGISPGSPGKPFFVLMATPPPPGPVLHTAPAPASTTVT